MSETYRCRHCGQAIDWIVSFDKRPVPVDPERRGFWLSAVPLMDTARQVRIITPGGHVLTEYPGIPGVGVSRGVEGYVFHADTCLARA